jgi:anti-sigma B factor antagonist
MSEESGLPREVAAGPRLQLQVHAADNRHTLCVGGEVDLATVPELEDALSGLIGVAREIVIDLDGVTFMDSQGLRCILTHQRECESRDIGFALAAVKPQARRVFEIAGVLDSLPFTLDSPCS